MNIQIKNNVKSTMDIQFEKFFCDNDGNPFNTNERLVNYSYYIGRLEGFIMDNCTDEQAQLFLEKFKNDPPQKPQ